MFIILIMLGVVAVGWLCALSRPQAEKTFLTHKDSTAEQFEKLPLKRRGYRVNENGSLTRVAVRKDPLSGVVITRSSKVRGIL